MREFQSRLRKERPIDYTREKRLCSISSQLIHIMYPKNSGLIKKELRKTAEVLAENIVPRNTICTFMIHNMPKVNPRTIRLALPPEMKDEKKSANARRQKSERLTGVFELYPGAFDVINTEFPQFRVMEDCFDQAILRLKKAKRAGVNFTIFWVDKENKAIVCEIPHVRRIRRAT